MKNKNKIIGISVICCLLLMLPVKPSKAVPPTWVGVNAGNKFTWTVTIHYDPFLQIMEDLGLAGDLPPDFTDYVPETAGLNLGVTILSVSDAQSYLSMQYVNVTCSISITFPGTTSLPNIAQFNTIILNFKENYTGAFMDLYNSTSIYSLIPGLFLPTNINWTQLVNEVNILKTTVPEIPDNLTISALDNGVSVSYPGGFIDFGVYNGTLDVLGVEVNYNTNGVLESAEATYGGEVLVTVGFAADQEIFGYEVSILLVISTGAIVGIIIYIRKRKE
ncbi:MAG: hypothetical protein ACFFEY_10940 [Candidatus Thorarchaeota archaeon]